MMRRTIRRHITATPDSVMDTLVDASQWPKWRPGLVDVRNVSDDPIVHSTAWTETRRLAGRDMSFLARAIEIDQPRVFAYTAKGDGFDVMFRWTVRWDNERVLVTQETGVRAFGLRNRVSAAGKTFLAQQDEALDRLRLLSPPKATITKDAQ